VYQLVVKWGTDQSPYVAKRNIMPLFKELMYLDVYNTQNRYMCGKVRKVWTEFLIKLSQCLTQIILLHYVLEYNSDLAILTDHTSI